MLQCDKKEIWIMDIYVELLHGYAVLLIRLIRVKCYELVFLEENTKKKKQIQQQI